MKVDLPAEIEGSPDPEGARVRFERFVDAGGVAPVDDAGRRLLAAVLSSGTFLPELLLADLTGWPRLVGDPWLTRPKPPGVIFQEVENATCDAVDFGDFKRRLRLVRRREMLRLGARELGWGTTEEVAAELSGFADACLELSYRFCDSRLRAEYGTPTLDNEIGGGGEGGSGGGGGDEPPPSFVIMAMGKLGGEELNFSSDVDLIYFYGTDNGHLVRTDAASGHTTAGSRSLHQYYGELSRRITEAIQEATADGYVFRVDLRLRPEGRGGPLCNSLAATERYYETFGRTWERQALLRARPCAGDRALGVRLLDLLDPFIYPRHLAPAMMNEIRSLRAQFRPKLDGPDDAFDVKLSGGGIRDVELVVQTLQLLQAGKRPDLRGRSTPRGLRRMEMAGLLTDREARTLAGAYRFWRQIEHRLQLQDGAQTQLVPRDAGARTLLAKRLGFPGLAAFDAQVAARRTDVNQIVTTFGDQEPDVPVKVMRLLALSVDRAEMEALLAELGFSNQEASADLIEAVGARLPPRLVVEAAASPDPDRALANFRDLIVRGTGAPLALFREDPQLLRILATLFGVSERLSRLLVFHPEMWGDLMDGLGEPIRSVGILTALLDARLEARVKDANPVGDEEESVGRALRRFASAETLRVGVHDVAGNVGAPAVATQLTELAEVCLRRGIAQSLAMAVERHGQPATSLTVLALGSLGAREMRYGSDLDLVFLYGDEGQTSRACGHQEFFSRLARRVINSFGALLEEGRLYDIDTRLRPSGQQGLLVTSQAAFARYHLQDAATWERVALLRARVVFTTGGPGERAGFEQMLAGIAYQRPFDAAVFGRDLRGVRLRVEAERGRVPAGSRHLRFDPGGIMDLEFLAALGQLSQGAADPALQTTDTSAVLARLAETGWPASLVADFNLLRTFALRMRLLRDRPEDVIGPADVGPLARSLEQDPARLFEDLDAAMSRVRRCFLERFP